MWLVGICLVVLTPLKVLTIEGLSSQGFVHTKRNAKRYSLNGLKATSTSSNNASIRSDPSDFPCVRLSFSLFLEEAGIDPELREVLLAVAASCMKVSQRLATLPLDQEAFSLSSDERTNIQGEKQKGMDVISNEIFIQTIRDTVAAIASEEEEDVILTRNGQAECTGNDGQERYEIAFDPLDGSSNLDISIPTGSIFGIAPFNQQKPFSKPGRNLVAAGYALYSSSTELVLALQNGTVVGFTLNPNYLDLDEKLQGGKEAADNERSDLMTAALAFQLSRPNIRCPSTGPYYSLNEAREPDWPDGLKRWVADAKRGMTPSGEKYSSRYVCSLCGDFHRTLLMGGWAGNPRPHLRLLYEAAPLCFVAEAAGGTGTDGVTNLLDLEIKNLHDRTCVFLGSKEDIQDLISYGDIQQAATKYQA